MLFALLGVMLLAAVLVVAVPLYRRERRLSTSSTAAAVTVLLISTLLYNGIGTPDADSQQSGDMPDVEVMVASLAAKLEQNPDDLEGWKMLGRSYVQLRQFPQGIAAYERAVDLEGRQDGQTLADLGEAMLISEDLALIAQSDQVFESAIIIAPDNQKVLFYAGMAALQRGENELGTVRWERLLATSPPENIQNILRQQIAVLRGEVPPPVAPLPTANAVVTVNVSLGEFVSGAVSPAATVFIIARDPAQPSPPIAAVRRQVSELPAAIAIGDADAMLPGRVPSGFAQLEIVARVSMSGQPIAQSGDWFGQQTISTEESSDVAITIDQQVP